MTTRAAVGVTPVGANTHIIGLTVVIKVVVSEVVTKVAILVPDNKLIEEVHTVAIVDGDLSKTHLVK